jgi:hypothetical protein
VAPYGSTWLDGLLNAAALTCRSAAGNSMASSADASADAPLVALPSDLLRTLLLRLAEPKLLAAVAQTCQRLRACAEEDELWTRLCVGRWPRTLPAAWLAAAAQRHGHERSPTWHRSCAGPVNEAPASARRVGYGGASLNRSFCSPLMGAEAVVVQGDVAGLSHGGRSLQLKC